MDQELYITEEELKAKSPEEMEKWMESLVQAAEESEEEMPTLTIEEYYKAFESPEYQSFLKLADEVDTTPRIFEDRADIEEVNKNYKAVRSLPENAVYGTVYYTWDKLYASLYSYIKRVNPLWETGTERLDIWAALQKEHPTVFTLDKSNAELFQNLCTPEAFSGIGKEGEYALGALRLSEGRKLAAGILIFSVLPPSEERMEAVAAIRWLYVDENLRGKHVADDLMAELYHLMHVNGIETVACDVPMQGLLPVTLANFLSSWWIFFQPKAVPADPDNDTGKAFMYLAGANVTPEEDITAETLEMLRPLYLAEHKQT